MSKMVNCKACNKEIAKGASKCPGCGKDQRSWFGRHKFLTGIIAIILLIIVVPKGNDVVPTSTTADAKTNTKVEEKKVPVKEFWKIGEGVKQGDTAMKVTKVERTKGGEYDSVKAGHEYVVVTINIFNTGTETISYNTFDFKMQNSQGQILDGTFSTYNQDSALNSGNLAANGKITGTLIYEQPKGDKDLTLIYTGNMFSTDGLKFKLQ